MARHSTAAPSPMPQALEFYWTMWNEPDLWRVRRHLEAAVAPNVLWTDPLHAFEGRDALEQNVRTLRTDKPEYFFAIDSELDAHHNRVRYQWLMYRRHRVLLRGLDVVTFDPSGLIERVDGFFDPIQLVQDPSSIPASLQFSA